MGIVPELNAQVDAAQMSDGSAVPEMNTVQPVKNTVRKPTLLKKLIAMAAPKRHLQVVKQDCPGTECPGGCCPNVGWFCCPGDEYCAASEEYCKKTNYAEKLIGMAAQKRALPLKVIRA